MLPHGARFYQRGQVDVCAHPTEARNLTVAVPLIARKKKARRQPGLSLCAI
jgi:hypothetical protein